MLPAIAQLGSEPKLLMLEDCPHWMWWDKKELLKEHKTDKQLAGILDGQHIPLRARHFFGDYAEGPCASGEMVVTKRESRVAGGYPVVETKHGPICSCAAPCAPRCSVRRAQSQTRRCRAKILTRKG